MAPVPPPCSPRGHGVLGNTWGCTVRLRVLWEQACAESREVQERAPPGTDSSARQKRVHRTSLSVVPCWMSQRNHVRQQVGHKPQKGGQ